VDAGDAPADDAVHLEGIEVGGGGGEDLLPRDPVGQPVGQHHPGVGRLVADEGDRRGAAVEGADRLDRVDGRRAAADDQVSGHVVLTFSSETRKSARTPRTNRTSAPTRQTTLMTLSEISRNSASKSQSVCGSWGLMKSGRSSNRMPMRWQPPRPISPRLPSSMTAPAQTRGPRGGGSVARTTVSGGPAAPASVGPPLFGSPGRRPSRRPVNLPGPRTRPRAASPPGTR